MRLELNDADTTLTMQTTGRNMVIGMHDNTDETETAIVLTIAEVTELRDRCNHFLENNQ